MGWFEEQGYAPGRDEGALPPDMAVGPSAPEDPRTPGTPVQGKPGFFWNAYGGYDTYAPGQGPNGPLTPAASGGTNQFGNAANLDPAYLEQQIRAAFAAAGKTPTDQDIQYWIQKASTPDIYSDNQVRVGWNPYWADRIRTGSGSSDPSLAGNEGLISNPEQYGFGTSRTADGRVFFSHLGDQEANGGGATAQNLSTLGNFTAPGGGSMSAFGSPASVTSSGGGGSAGVSGGAPTFNSLGGFQAPPVPGVAPTYTPTAFTAPDAFKPTAITAQGAAPSYTAGTIDSVTGAPAFQAGTINAQGAYQPYEAPSAFKFDQPVPSYTSTAPLNAAKPAPTLAPQTAFTYDPLKTSEAFKLPTGQEALEQDPGYKFRLEQGLGALESSAAAKGVLRTGGTYKGLIDYGQRAGSEEYGNAVGRARDVYTINQGVRQAEQGQQFGQNLAADERNADKALTRFNAELAGQGQEFQQAATQHTVNEGDRLAAHNANLTGQNQGFTQAATTSTINAKNSLDAAVLNSGNYNAGADRDLAAQGQNKVNAFNAATLNSSNINTTNALNTDIGRTNQANAFNAATLNSSNVNTAADRDLTAQGQTQANALAAAGLNANTSLVANAQNNDAKLAAAKFNADQKQQGYQNAFTAAATGRTFEQQENLAANAHKLAGYQTDVNKDLSQQQIDQGWKSLNLTAEQQAFTRNLSAQQQQWMQAYMERGQTWDEAFRQMEARLRYA